MIGDSFSSEECTRLQELHEQLSVKVAVITSAVATALINELAQYNTQRAAELLERSIRKTIPNPIAASRDQNCEAGIA